MLAGKAIATFLVIAWNVPMTLVGASHSLKCSSDTIGCFSITGQVVCFNEFLLRCESVSISKHFHCQHNVSSSMQPFYSKSA